MAAAKKPLRILLIEDDPYDLELVVATLRDSGFQFDYDNTRTGAGLMALLDQNEYNLILSDYNMPGFDGLTALRLVRERTSAIPFILVSGAMGEEIAIESLRAGATDYVLKDRLARLGPVVKRALQEYEERLTRIKAEQALRLLNQAVEQSPVSVVITDASGAIQYVNPKFCQLTGYSAGEAIGQNPRILQSGDQAPAFYRKMWDALSSGQEWRGEFHNKKKNGELYWELASIAGVKDQAGNITHYVAVKEDITERKQLEEEHLRQERLASVGQLAAGIAHDFNNILAAIGLYSEIVGRSKELSDGNKKRMGVINQQVWHASRLIGQILDFSRQSVLQRHPLNLQSLLEEQVNLLQRTLPENIAIELQCEPGEYTVEGDPTRIQQVLTNLAVNARDAMPNGGRLTITLGRLAAEPDQLPWQPTTSAKTYIRLNVTDTGTGIPPQNLPHIFDPFFTTKAPGEGTGLGLAQIHGIVGQHHGYIDVESQMGVGSSFTVYLPALEIALDAAPAQDDSSIHQGQGQVLLVVEDEATLRAAMLTILEQWNYRVLEAANGKEALAVLEAHRGQIDLVLSDMVMPDMGGIALFQTLRQNGWALPMILISGHPLDRVNDELKELGVAACFTKPPDLNKLVGTIAQTLAARSPARMTR